ncbi:hypothetical protein [Paenibacillus sp. Mc5Re-14]|uniref:hypothetical protein n=1 Tax=Paenibacillus sp. Mc5Re-14 TaxID=1030529 RepID=UPI000AFC1BD1|nr:hypothetical protein [Paenibacillus sp. Mc5Re-14]
MSTLTIKRGNVLLFKERNGLHATKKTIQEYVEMIKPFHLQSEEYQLSSIEAMYDDEEDD